MKDNTKKSNISLSSYSFIFQISQMPKSLNVVAVAPILNTDCFCNRE